MRLIHILLLLAFIFCGCNNRQEENPCDSFSLKILSEYMADEFDHQIINTVIKSYHSSIDMAHLVQHTEHLVLTKTSEQLSRYGTFDLDQSLFKSIVEQNDTTYILSPSATSQPLELLTDEEIECLFDESYGGWKCYYEKYPDSKGIFRFTRVGINTTGDMAIVEYSYYRWGDSGEYCFVVLAFRDGVWEAEERVVLYVS